MSYLICVNSRWTKALVFCGLLICGEVSPADKSPALTCHCSDGNTCDKSNGFCWSGCQKGWQGPGCQIDDNFAIGTHTSWPSGNCSRHDASWQRCLLTSYEVVDGIVPPEDSAVVCLHTLEEENPFWIMFFNESRQYVIQAVTIFSQPGNSTLLPWCPPVQCGIECLYGFVLESNGCPVCICRDQPCPPLCLMFCPHGNVIEKGCPICRCRGPNSLRNFDIMISNATRGETQFPSAWYGYAHQAGVLIGNKTFYFSNVIGRSLAIYGKASGRQILALCEVTVRGYVYQECVEGKTGPGCLLHKCNSPACISRQGTCLPDGTCSFVSCPGYRHWPPDCWMKMPDLSRSRRSILKNKESVLASISPALNIESNFKITSIILEVQEMWSGRVYMAGRFNLSHHLEAELPVEPFNYYTFSWLAEVCSHGTCTLGPAASQEVQIIDCLYEVPAFGCLLHGCLSKTCLTKRGTCILNKHCNFSPCPGNGEWPPDCTTKMPNLSQSVITYTVDRGILRLSLSITPNYGDDFNISAVVLNVQNTKSGSASETLTMDTSTGEVYSASIYELPTSFYRLSWKPKVCVEDICHYGPEIFRIISISGDRPWLLYLLLIIPFFLAATIMSCQCLKRCLMPRTITNLNAVTVSPESVTAASWQDRSANAKREGAQLESPLAGVVPGHLQQETG